MLLFTSLNVIPIGATKVEARLRKIAADKDMLATSDAVRLETLVGPFQSGDTAVLADYQKFF